MDDNFAERLKELGVSEAAIQTLMDQELNTPESLAEFTFEQYVAMGVKAGSAKVLVANYFKPPVPTPEPANEGPKMASTDILPSVPDDASYLEMLKTGGELRVERVDVISAVRAAIAAESGLFALPELLRNKMKEFAESQDVPVGNSYYALEKAITSRNYSEIFSALNISGVYANKEYKAAMIKKLNAILWNALQSFHSQLESWGGAWNTGAFSPGIATWTLIANMAQVGGGVAQLPPGMMQPPDATPLKDAAETVVNDINKVFAGVGIPVTRAMAYDAMKIREVLDDPTLPAATGFTTRDQMLKGLGIAVGADFVRLERNVTRYVLSIMEFPGVTVGNAETSYLYALLQLGAAIPWDKLPSNSYHSKEDDYPMTGKIQSHETRPY